MEKSLRLAYTARKHCLDAFKNFANKLESAGQFSLALRVDHLANVFYREFGEEHFYTDEELNREQGNAV